MAVALLLPTAAWASGGSGAAGVVEAATAPVGEPSPTGLERDCAAGSGESGARTCFIAGEQAERAGDVAAASRLWRRVMELSPSGRYARRAGRLLTGLHDADASELEALKREAWQLDRDEVERRWSAAFERAQRPETRAALLLWRAERVGGVGSRVEFARFDALLDAPLATADERHRMIRAYVRSARDARDAWSAMPRLEAWLVRHGPEVSAGMRAELRDELVDRVLEAVAVTVSGLIVTVLWLRAMLERAWHSLMAGRKGWLRPAPYLFVAWAFGGAGLLAEGWEEGYLPVFVVAGLAVASMLLLGAATDEAMRRAGRPRSRGWVVLQAAGTLATVILVFAAMGEERVLGM
jgi:hypothetical protein